MKRTTFNWIRLISGAIIMLIAGFLIWTNIELLSLWNEITHPIIIINCVVIVILGLSLAIPVALPYQVVENWPKREEVEERVSPGYWRGEE